MSFSDLLKKVNESLGDLAKEHQREMSLLCDQLELQAAGFHCQDEVLQKYGLGCNNIARKAKVPVKTVSLDLDDDTLIKTNSMSTQSPTVFPNNLLISVPTQSVNFDLCSPKSVMNSSSSHSVLISSGSASAAVCARTSTPRSMTDGHEGATQAFELKEEWTKVPDAYDAEHFLDDVDKMLMERAASQMSSMERKSRGDAASRSSVRNAEIDPILEFSRFLINPSSPKRMTWDVVGMSLIVYDMVWIPFQLSFTPEATIPTDAMAWTTLFFWSLDIILSFFTGFYRKGDLIMSHMSISANYLKGWFWIDVLVVGPDWFFKAVGSVTNAAGLGRILRIARMMRVLRLLRLLKLKRLFNMLYDMIDSEATFIAFNLIKLLVMIIFMNHVVACGWYLMGKLSKDVGAPKNWLQDVGKTPVWGEDLSWKYLTSLHWSLTQFTPASMDIFATNTLERAYSVLVLLWALVALSSIIGSVSAQMTALRNLSADENKQFWLLRRYLKQKSVSRDLTDRIVNYLEFQQVAKHNLVPPSQVILLGQLSEQFKMEISHEMYWRTLSVHPLFQYMNSDDIMKKSVQRLCYEGFKSCPSAAFEVLFNLGDEGRTMFFVRSGAYEYELGDGTVLEKYIEPKYWVSEAVLWTSWRHRGSLIATKPGEALALSPSMFSGTLRLHPKPWYLGMHYGVDFVNYLNRCPVHSLSDIIFDAEVFVTVVKESDTYCLVRKHSDKRLVLSPEPSEEPTSPKSSCLTGEETAKTTDIASHHPFSLSGFKKHIEAL